MLGMLGNFSFGLFFRNHYQVIFGEKEMVVFTVP
jgi:hypothetical protein